DAIGANLGSLDEPVVQLSANPFLLDLAELVHVQDEFIQLHGIIPEFPDLELPRTDVRSIIQDMFQLVEVDQSPLDLVELHRLDFRVAGDLSQQTRQDTAAMGAGTVDLASFDDVPGSVTEDHAAAGFQGGENQFPRLSFGDRDAG